MAIPIFLQPCFPSYDLKSLDKERDKKLIITQILNHGIDRDIRWLGKNYSQKEIKKAISSPTRGMWMKSVLSYWLKIFNLKLSKKTLDKAIINLNRF